MLNSGEDFYYHELGLMPLPPPKKKPFLNLCTNDSFSIVNILHDPGNIK